MKNLKLKILFILSLSLLFFLLFSKNVSAKENFCDQEPCFIPAPTIITPINNATSTNPRPSITGLTWKTTKVSVFVDDVEIKNIKQVKHEDYYGSFYVKLDYDLKPGTHIIYAYAQSEKPDWGGKSKSSYYTHYTFIVPENINSKDKNVDPLLKSDNNIEKTTNASSTPSSNLNNEEHLLNEAPVINYENTPVVKDGFVNKTEVKVVETDNQGGFMVNEKNLDGSVSVTSTSNQQLSGGTQEVNEENSSNSDSQYLQPAASKEEVVEELKGQTSKTIDDYQQRLKTNRMIGFIILAGIALVSLLWLLIKEPQKPDQQK